MSANLVICRIWGQLLGTQTSLGIMGSIVSNSYVIVLILLPENVTCLEIENVTFSLTVRIKFKWGHLEWALKQYDC